MQLGQRTTRAWYARLLEAGRREDVFRELDPTFFFFTVMGACEFIFSAAPWFEHAFGEHLDEDYVERFVEHTVEFVLGAVAAPERVE